MKPRTFLLLALCAIGACTAVPGSGEQLARQLERKYPSGSILSVDQAERAAADAAAVRQQVQADFEAQQRHCADVFFAIHCLAAARSVQHEGELVVRRVTLEAHDLRRHADARTHDESRASELHRQAEEDALRPERERQALEDAAARERGAASRAEEARKDEEAARKAQADSVERLRAQQQSEALKEQERPALETTAGQAYRKKQEDAAAYARKKALDQQANEKRRAERQAEREAQNRIDEAQQKKQQGQQNQSAPPQ